MEWLNYPLGRIIIGHTKPGLPFQTGEIVYVIKRDREYKDWIVVKNLNGIVTKIYHENLDYQGNRQI